MAKGQIVQLLSYCSQLLCHRDKAVPELLLHQLALASHGLSANSVACPAPTGKRAPLGGHGGTANCFTKVPQGVFSVQLGLKATAAACFKVTDSFLVTEIDVASYLGFVCFQVSVFCFLIFVF